MSRHPGWQTLQVGRPYGFADRVKFHITSHGGSIKEEEAGGKRSSKTQPQNKDYDEHRDSSIINMIVLFSRKRASRLRVDRRGSTVSTGK